MNNFPEKPQSISEELKIIEEGMKKNNEKLKKIREILEKKQHAIEEIIENWNKSYKEAEDESSYSNNKK